MLMDSLLRSFLILVPIRLLTFPQDVPPLQIHDFLLNEILLNSHALSYPPSDEYQTRFWKWAIANLERVMASDPELEIDERIFEHYASLIANPRLSATYASTLSGFSQPPQSSYVTYTWPRTNHANTSSGLHGYLTATLVESRLMIQGGTTGLHTWSASFALAQYLLSNPEVIQKKRILELGSGTGFLGIVLATIQRPFTRIRLSDVNSEVLQQCLHNIKLPCNASSTHPDLQICSLDWFSALPGDSKFDNMLATMSTQFDVDLILGADLVFDPSLILPLVHTLQLALSPSSPKYCLLALTIRNQETFDTFIRAARDIGLTVDDLGIHYEENLFSKYRLDTKILRITVKPKTNDVD